MMAISMFAPIFHCLIVALICIVHQLIVTQYRITLSHIPMFYVSSLDCLVSQLQIRRRRTRSNLESMSKFMLIFHHVIIAVRGEDELSSASQENEDETVFIGTGTIDFEEASVS